MSLSARRAWIEIDYAVMPVAYKYGSLSARRAWIEMTLAAGCRPAHPVALRKESVDRNWLLLVKPGINPVALRKESVDRNHMGHAKPRRVIWSLSARRAWIEIPVNIPQILDFARRSPQGERG